MACAPRRGYLGWRSLAKALAARRPDKDDFTRWEGRRDRIPGFAQPSPALTIRPPSLPSTLVPALARARQLLAPEELAGVLADGRALLLEVACGGAAVFEQAHIPGARYLDTSALEHGPLFNKVDDAVLLEVLLGLGIRHDTTIVLYGRNNLAAARAAHLMQYAGVRDVRLLDGGYGAWSGLGVVPQNGPAAPRAPEPAFGAPFPGRPDYLIDLAGARALMGRSDATLVSIRTWSEYAGLTSGYSYIAARGDIPGARWGRAGRDGDVNSMSDFQHEDGRMLPAAGIARQWRELGVHPELQLAFYCGTGWRASVAFFYAWLMGWEQISVFDGGWFEYSLGATS